MADKRTLMQRLIDAGYPESDIDHHETDLYVYDTPLVYSVIRKYELENKIHLTREIFTDQITGRKMIDIAFAYDPEWERRLRGSL